MHRISTAYDWLKHLDDSDRNVRNEVVNLLKEIGTQRAILQLQVAARKDPTFMKKGCEEAIDAIKKRASESRSSKAKAKT